MGCIVKFTNHPESISQSFGQCWRDNSRSTLDTLLYSILRIRVSIRQPRSNGRLSIFTCISFSKHKPAFFLFINGYLHMQGPVSSPKRTRQNLPITSTFPVYMKSIFDPMRKSTARSYLLAVDWGHPGPSSPCKWPVSRNPANKPLCQWDDNLGPNTLRLEICL